MIAGADPVSSAFSKPAGISTAARTFLSEIRAFQSAVAVSTLNLPDFSSSARTPGESAPPITMTRGTSTFALETMAVVAFPTPRTRAGMMTVGMTIVEISVRRSRSVSLSSLA